MKTKLLFFTTLLLLPVFIMAQNQKKVAVYVIGEDAGLNNVLGSKLVSAIARSKEYTAIERTAAFLAELSKEQKYQRTGTVDDSELSRLGKQFGVQYVCVAAVSEAFNEKYLSARLIDVESAQVERTASSSGAIQDVSTAINAAETVSNELLSSFGKNRQSNAKKVAVYIVKNDAAINVGRVLGDKLVAGFTDSGRYIAIERTNSFLTQLNKEQNYQRSGAVDDSDISRLGKQFGVQYVCIADVSNVFEEKYISARLIDVETAEVVNTHDIGGVIKNMNDCIRMANEIASELSKGTFADQAEEARIKAEEEARIKAEKERVRLEQERVRLEQERAKQARVERRKEELRKMLNDGYVVLRDYDGVKWMVCLEPIVLSSKEYKTAIEKVVTFSRCGYNDWIISCYKNFNVLSNMITRFGNQEMNDYVSGKSDYCINHIWYIANECEHYLGVSFPLFKGGYYWDYIDSLGNYRVSRSSLSMIFLDGVDRREVSMLGTLIFKNREGSIFRLHSKAAYAFLVRRM